MAAIVPTWYLTSRLGSPSLVRQPVADGADSILPFGAPEELVAVATADPLTHYFGQPMTGTTIGFVVDCDESMSPYIDRVAQLTNYFTASRRSASRRYGIVQATADGRQTLNEVIEPTSDLAGGRPMVTPRIGSGRTNLVAALSRTGNWYADRIFLVLAKPLDDAEVDILARTAEQTGAVVNVVALGSAASQKNLASVANAAGGKFISLNDEMFNDLSQRHYAAEKATEAAGRN